MSKLLRSRREQQRDAVLLLQDEVVLDLPPDFQRLEIDSTAFRVLQCLRVSGPGKIAILLLRHAPFEPTLRAPLSSLAALRPHDRHDQELPREALSRRLSRQAATKDVKVPAQNLGTNDRSNRLQPSRADMRSVLLSGRQLDWSSVLGPKSTHDLLQGGLWVRVTDRQVFAAGHEPGSPVPDRHDTGHELNRERAKPKCHRADPGTQTHALLH